MRTDDADLFDSFRCLSEFREYRVPIRERRTHKKEPAATPTRAIRAWEPSFDAFLERNEGWFVRRLSESEDRIVYGIPEHELLALQGTCQCTNADLESEAALGQLCRDHFAVGLHEDWPISTRRIAPFRREFDQSSMPTLERIAQGSPSGHNLAGVGRSLPRCDVFDRMDNVLGQLLCRPDFIRDRDIVRAEWRSLPRSLRPRCPLLLHSMEFFLGPEKLAKVSGFVERFTAFCRRWTLMGMASWDVPEPYGPRWGGPSDRLPFSHITPPHFSAKRREFPTRKQYETYRHASDRAGFEQVRSDQSFARLFLTDFWNRVLDRRYRDEVQRRRGYVLRKQTMIAAIMVLTAVRKCSAGRPDIAALV